MDQRQAKALHIAATTKLSPKDGRWKVPSQTGSGTTYTVLVTRDGSWSCSCPDFEERLQPCKHSMAVEITCQRESNREGMVFTETFKVSYTQKWHATTKRRPTRKPCS